MSRPGFLARIALPAAVAFLVALAAFVLAMLIAGGVSLFLGLRIHEINTRIDQNFSHALAAGEIYDTFHQIISEVQHIQATGMFNRFDRLPGLRRALAMSPAKVIEEIKQSGLTGRGGAGVRVADVVERLAVQERPVVAGVRGDERDPVPRVDRDAPRERRRHGDRVVREPLEERPRLRREVVGRRKDPEDVRVRLADPEPPVEPDVRGNPVVAGEKPCFEGSEIGIRLARDRGDGRLNA